MFNIYYIFPHRSYKKYRGSYMYTYSYRFSMFPYEKKIFSEFFFSFFLLIRFTERSEWAQHHIPNHAKLSHTITYNTIPYDTMACFALPCYSFPFHFHYHTMPRYTAYKGKNYKKHFGGWLMEK